MNIESCIVSLMEDVGEEFLERSVYAGKPAEFALYELAVGLALKGHAAKLSQLLSEAIYEVKQQAA